MSLDGPPVNMAIVDPTLEALWLSVVEEWGDDERHGKLLAYAQQTRQLGDVAGLYRRVNEDGSPYRVSADHLIDAKKRLAGVAMLAVMDLDSTKSDATDVRGQHIVRIIGFVVVLGLFAALGWLLLQR